MSFWCTQTARKNIKNWKIISDPEPRIEQGALAMRLGPEAAISDDSPTIIRLSERQELKIPPGQFALLLTEEIVQLPNKVLGLISLKTKIKSQGLINVSGFHVDPGYQGRLKFWVYNAGNLPVIIKRGDFSFMLWFSDFDQIVEDPYVNKPGQSEITSDDLSKMRGKLCSPSALYEELKSVRNTLTTLKLVLGAFISIIAGVVIERHFELFTESPPNDLPKATSLVLPAAPPTPTPVAPQPSVAHP